MVNSILALCTKMKTGLVHPLMVCLFTTTTNGTSPQSTSSLIFPVVVIVDLDFVPSSLTGSKSVMSIVILGHSPYYPNPNPDHNPKQQ